MRPLSASALLSAVVKLCLLRRNVRVIIFLLNNILLFAVAGAMTFSFNLLPVANDKE